MCYLSFVSKENVREHIPLEQGLRQFGICLLTDRGVVREHIPLEQGLRLYLRG